MKAGTYYTLAVWDTYYNIWSTGTEDVSLDALKCYMAEYQKKYPNEEYKIFKTIVTEVN